MNSTLLVIVGNYQINVMPLLIMLAFVVLMIASLWKVNTKAGKPGWACLVPIYNLIVILQIARKPIWWIFLVLIPFVNIIVLILVYIEVAKGFGKETGFGLGLAFLGFIFFPILAFSDAKYIWGEGEKTIEDHLV